MGISNFVDKLKYLAQNISVSPLFGTKMAQRKNQTLVTGNPALAPESPGFSQKVLLFKRLFLLHYFYLTVKVMGYFL